MNDSKANEDPSLLRAKRIDSIGYDYASQEKQPVRSCNLCGADQWVILAFQDRYGFPAQAMTCRVCGLTMLNPCMTSNSYGEFYKGIYRPLVSAYHGRIIDAQTIQEEQKGYAKEMEQLLAPFMQNKNSASFLDVGGSTGIIAAHFAREFKVRATVLDPAPDEIAEADALGIETVTSFVEDWQHGGRRFDLIGMFKTVDHLLDVSKTLKTLRSLIADDGLFIIDVVDFRAVYLKKWSIEDSLKIDHPFSLTDPVMEAYLLQSGFKTVRKAYGKDRQLIVYICSPTTLQPDALPSPESVERFLYEVRYVQNAPRGAVAL
jgi:SAM-dependent methyltransferase